MQKTIRATATALLLVGTPAIALAHAQLSRADPIVGGTVHRPPTQVELTFGQAVEPRFSTITVTDASGRQVDQHDVHTVSGDARRLAVTLGPVPPGIYGVTWHATSVDTHKTEGTFSFTVAP